ncbi:MAG: hypothetical protein H8E59_01430 [Actinobacteria bacterium]|nr:hypothetical protein [Actinomycetota bacterium]
MSDFFYAYTLRRPACRWVQVSLWNWALGSPCGGAFVGVGPLSTYFSSASTYSDTINGYSYEYMCSNHAAWDEDWVLHVPWVSLRAGVPG